MTDLVTIPFAGDRIQYVVESGEPFVPIRPICDALGVSNQMQQRKLSADTGRWSVIMMMMVGADGKAREMLCLPLARVFGWLATISPTRVKPEARERLITYQRECAHVLFEHFMGRAQREVAEANAAALRLAEDLIARKPLWVRIRAFAAQGWGFEAIWRASGRTQAVVDEAIRDLLRLGLIPAAPAGTPSFAQPGLFDAA